MHNVLESPPRSLIAFYSHTADPVQGQETFSQLSHWLACHRLNSQTGWPNGLARKFQQFQ